MTNLTNGSNHSSAPSQDAAASVGPAFYRHGVIGGVFDLFSSVKLGITLLVLLFVYSSVGSAGIFYPESWNIFSVNNWSHDQFRQWRGLEMTEFEWFHWWPFNTLMLLIALNIIVTTLRFIAFKPVNYGVWMIHIGVLMLIASSFYYFGTKVEGDAPVARRKVVASFPMTATDGSIKTETVEFLAAPGVRVAAGEGANAATFEVMQIDPSWELLTGADKGTRAYSVTVAIERNGKRFMRQLLAGFPALTEDLILTDDPAQPMQRSIKATGNAIYDDALSMTLDYEAQQWFYLRNELVKSWALYVRAPGTTQWTERAIDGLPLYNDYIGDRSQVFQSPGDEVLPLDPLDIHVKATSESDPFPDVELRVTGYLRYAMERSRFFDAPAGGALNPVVNVTIASESGQTASYRLIARDAEQSTADNGLLRFANITDEAAFTPLTRQPGLVVRIPSKGVEIREQIRDVAAANPDAPFVEIAGSGGEGIANYAYRVMNVRDDVPVAGTSVSLAILEVRTPKGLYRRWVFSDPTLTRDVTEKDASDPHGGSKLEDDSIDISYEPGNGLALVTIVHGPEEGRMRVLAAIGATPIVKEIKVGETVALAGGINLTLNDMMLRATLETKPFVVARMQRERDAMEMFALIQLEAPGAASEWIPFNRWVFDAPERVLRKSPYQPRTIRLADGRDIEVLFSRQRLPLRADVSLEQFNLTSHIGGFTGAQGSIRDYTSEIRFRDEASSWSAPVAVSVNSPVEHNGLWFFQAQWDPPDEARAEGEAASRGLNYTVLGVGNRNGVHFQLISCCIAVSGMIYAFYVKPVIKRRKQAEVLAGLARGTLSAKGTPNRKKDAR